MNKYQEQLRINHREKRFLGVCAGIADYLDMPVTLVRIITLVCIVSWPTLILAYFGIYIFLNKKITTDQVYGFFSNNGEPGHFKNLNFRRPIYRNRRNMKIAGVCSGIADYLEIRPGTVRIVAVISAFLMGPYAVLAYCVAWFAMNPDPAPRSSYSSRQQRRHARKERRAKRWSHGCHGYTSSRINEAEDGSADDLYNPNSTSTDESYDPVESVASSKMNSNSSSRSNTRSFRNDAAEKSDTSETSLEECADVYYAMESRMREIEAFMTSKKFRLHCEINRI